MAEVDTTPRVRLTLDLGHRMDAQLTQLAAKRGESKAETMRYALALLYEADRARSEGLNVGAWKEQGNVRREMIFTGL